MMEIKDLLRGLSLAAVLLAGSCAVPVTNAANGPMEDGAVNHPIAVEPSYQSIKLYYAPADAGISPADQSRFDSFVADYQAHGNGAIAVSAPAGINSAAMTAFFAQRINDMGVPKNRILVASHDAPDNDQRVEINYISYQAHTDKCGDWSEDLAFTADNLTPKNFGCAVQQNIAAQVADPRDLLQPRPSGDASAVRRDTVIGNYEAGKITSAEKRKSDLGNEQSGTSSDVVTK
jgi:pilus assembly protein CpaD